MDNVGADCRESRSGHCIMIIRVYLREREGGKGGRGRGRGTSVSEANLRKKEGTAVFERERHVGITTVVYT